MLIDSNILIYAINTASPKHKKAQEFLQDNLGNLVVAHQNILESMRVLTHPKFENPMKINKAINAIEKILEHIDVIYPDFKTIAITFNLTLKYGLSSDLVFDAYLAATALTNGEDMIATDNVKDFEKFLPIKVVNPF